MRGSPDEAAKVDAGGARPSTGPAVPLDDISITRSLSDAERSRFALRRGDVTHPRVGTQIIFPPLDGSSKRVEPPGKWDSILHFSPSVSVFESTGKEKFRFEEEEEEEI